MARVAYINIEPAIMVDIHEHDAGAPHAVLFKTGMGGDVLEVEIAFIEIELVLAHIGCKEDVGEAIVVEIANGYAAAVVEVPEEEAVVQFLIHHFVVKVDAGVIHELKEGGVLWVIAAGTKDDEEKEKKGLDDFHVLNGKLCVQQKKQRPL